MYKYIGKNEDVKKTYVLPVLESYKDIVKILSKFVVSYPEDIHHTRVPQNLGPGSQNNHGNYWPLSNETVILSQLFDRSYLHRTTFTCIYPPSLSLSPITPSPLCQFNTKIQFLLRYNFAHFVSSKNRKLSRIWGFLLTRMLLTALELLLLPWLLTEINVGDVYILNRVANWSFFHNLILCFLLNIVNSKYSIHFVLE